MKICFLTAGTFGDVKPNVALAVGLKKAGHDVRFISSTDAKDYIIEKGLEYYSADFSIKDLSQEDDAKRIMDSGDKTKNHFLDMKTYLNHFIEKLFMKGIEGGKGCDLLIPAGFGIHVGYHVGEALGVPVIPIIFQPQSMTAQYPLCFFPPLPFGKKIQGVYNKLTYELSDDFLLFAIKKTLNECREKVGLGKGSHMKFHKTLRENHAPIIYAISELVLPKPSDYPDYLHFTGYYFLDGDMEYNASQDLLDFLEDGEKPIHIGFGSITMKNPDSLRDIILEALDLCHRRAVILTGWGGLQINEKRNNIYVAKSLPHDWLFPKMAAIVQHSGGGTTFTNIRSGVPAIPVPFTMDCPFWGRVAYNAGVSVQPLNPKNMTAKILADAINVATTDQKLIERAKVLGERMMQEDGVQNAVAIINHYLENYKFKIYYFTNPETIKKSVSSL